MSTMLNRQRLTRRIPATYSKNKCNAQKLCIDTTPNLAIALPAPMIENTSGVGTPLMDCACCQLTQRKFYCKNCLKSRLQNFRTSLTQLQAQRDEQLARATKLLATTQDARTSRADLASAEMRLDEVRAEAANLRERNDDLRARLASLRTSLAARRTTLLTARTLPTQAANLNTTLTTFKDSHSELSDKIARARAVLVQSVLDLFCVTDSPTSSPTSHSSYGNALHAHQRAEWSITGLILPVPGDMKRYSIEHINAALEHALHLLGLLTRYLGIKLPFEVRWTGGVEGVGRPEIFAGRGEDKGGWARYTTPQPLYISPSPATNALSRPSSPSANSSTTTPAASVSIALSMLAYNVAYLAHTQHLPISLSQTPEILRNIWATCYTPEIGKRSHATGHVETIPPSGSASFVAGSNLTASVAFPCAIPGGGLLPAPTPANFQLDFGQVVQVMDVNPGQSGQGYTHHGSGRAHLREKEKVVTVLVGDDEGWDLVDDM